MGNKNLRSIIGAVLAILLVAGSAAGAYIISSRVSGRQAVAPTAPESKPLAGFAECETNADCPDGYTCKTVSGVLKCVAPPTATPTNPPSTRTPTPPPLSDTCGAGYYCRSLGSTGCLSGKGAPEACKTNAGISGNCCYPRVTPTPTPTSTLKQCGVNLVCRSEVLAGGYACLTSASPTGKGYCCPLGYIIDGDMCKPTAGAMPLCKGTQDCNENRISGGAQCNAFNFGQPNTTLWCCPPGVIIQVDKSDPNNWRLYCPGGGGGTPPPTRTPTPTSNVCATGRDPKASNQIKFARTGTIMVFTKNLAGTVKLTGPKTVTLTSTAGSAVQIPQTFNVTAGQIYTVSVKWNADTTPGFGWIKRKATYTCGPTNATCGANLDIKPLISLATSKATLTGISAGTVPANVQCWGDKAVGDVSQDYDYNDGSVVFGYKKAPPGACMNVKLFKKNTNGTYQATPVSSATPIVKGDKLRVEITANRLNLTGRFKVLINGVIENTGNTASPVWRVFSGTATSKILRYDNYEIKKIGSFSFVTQVTTKPVAVSSAADLQSADVQTELDAQRDFNLGVDQGALDSSQDAAPDDEEITGGTTEE